MSFLTSIFYIKKLITILRALNSRSIDLTLRLPSREAQEEYLSRFPEPVDDIERSFFQYRCQCYFAENLLSCNLKNAAALVLLAVVLLKNIVCLSRSKNAFTTTADVFFFEGTIQIAPDSLLHNLKKVSLSTSVILSISDIKFIWMIVRRYPFSFMFILKNVLKISMYSAAIKTYRPSKIVCSCEYSYTSSILTNYCESNDITHVIVMHGEKIFNIRQSFCRFNLFFVWDKYYTQLFKELRADNSIFVVEKPAALKLETAMYALSIKECYDYTFYLTIEDRDSLIRLRTVADKLKQAGKRVILRPHPLRTNIAVIKKFFHEDEIEMPHDVNLSLSVARTDNAVSIGSTVLYQAYLAGKNVVIDDITNIKRFVWFKENDFIMMNKKHTLLSDVIKNLHQANNTDSTTVFPGVMSDE